MRAAGCDTVVDAKDLSVSASRKSSAICQRYMVFININQRSRQAQADLAS